MNIASEPMECLPLGVVKLRGRPTPFAVSGGEVAGHVPLEAMLLLRAHPEVTPHFDNKYGGGMAALILETH
jgi:hypothetical protein